MAPTSSRSSRDGNRGGGVVAREPGHRMGDAPSRDSTRCMVARPIGPINMIATNADSRTHIASDLRGGADDGDGLLRLLQAQIAIALDQDGSMPLAIWA
jgi:hypothetical protein